MPICKKHGFIPPSECAFDNQTGKYVCPYNHGLTENMDKNERLIE